MKTPTRAQQRLYNRIAFGGFALTVVAMVLALIDPSLVFGSGLVLAFTGTAYTEGRVGNTGEDVHIKPSVSDALTRIEPSSFPFTQFLMRARRGQKAKDILHQWGEISRFKRSDAVNGATLAGGAGAAVTVTVNDGAMWRPDDVFISLTNATDTTASNMYWVESITGNDLDVRVLPVSAKTNPYAGDAYGTVPAFADTEVIYWIGNQKSESFQNTASRIQQPAYQFNFVHTFDATIRYADHKRWQENFGPRDIRRYRRDNLFEFRKNLEYSAVFNRAPAKTADPTTTELRYQMGGMWHYASSTTITLVTTGGVPSESQGVDFIYSCFDDNNGSRRKLLIGGKDLMKAVDKINTSDLQTRRSEMVAGVQVQRLEGRIGRLITAYHPGFDETGRAGEGLVIDMKHVRLVPYAPMERRPLELKGQGVDAEGEYWTVKHTLEARNADTHKRVNFSV